MDDDSDRRSEAKFRAEKEDMRHERELDIVEEARAALQARNDELYQRNVQLRARVAELEDQVAALERRLPGALPYTIGVDKAAPGGDLTIVTDYEIHPDGTITATDVRHVPPVDELAVARTTDNDLVDTVPKGKAYIDRHTIPRRGVDFACEECGKLEGSSLDNRGFYRCHGCGYPGQ